MYTLLTDLLIFYPNALAKQGDNAFGRVCPSACLCAWALLLNSQLYETANQLIDRRYKIYYLPAVVKLRDWWWELHHPGDTELPHFLMSWYSFPHEIGASKLSVDPVNHIIGAFCKKKRPCTSITMPRLLLWSREAIVIHEAVQDNAGSSRMYFLIVQYMQLQFLLPGIRVVLSADQMLPSWMNGSQNIKQISVRCIKEDKTLMDYT